LTLRNSVPSCDREKHSVYEETKELNVIELAPVASDIEDKFLEDFNTYAVFAELKGHVIFHAQQHAYHLLLGDRAFHVRFK